jgi:hypothetical protein
VNKLEASTELPPSIGAFENISKFDFRALLSVSNDVHIDTMDSVANIKPVLIPSNQNDGQVDHSVYIDILKVPEPQLVKRTSQDELSSSIFKRSNLFKDDIDSFSLILGGRQSSGLVNRLAWQPSILKTDFDYPKKSVPSVHFEPEAKFSNLAKLLSKFFKCRTIGYEDLNLMPHELKVLRSVIARKFYKPLKVEYANKH